MNSDIIIDTFDACKAEVVSNSVIYAIQDLELLIERHTQRRYSEDYSLLFRDRRLASLNLTEGEADQIVYFLTFMLFNYPDRVDHVSHAFKKCYGYNLMSACFFGIEIYVSKDDFATINLLEFILNQSDRAEIPSDSMRYFELASQKGLPFTKQYLKRRGLIE